MELTKKQGREITQRALDGIAEALEENMDNFKAHHNPSDGFFFLSTMEQEKNEKGTPVALNCVTSGTPAMMAEMFGKAFDESPEFFQILKVAVAKQCFKSILSDKK